MNNPYVNFALWFQAYRRDAERKRSPLCGALGVRARIYTHQLANVARILASEEIRHLLADEVGLGKTVQALMVVNALRIQNPGLRVLVLVPDRTGLVQQWSDEILTRAHISPEMDDVEENQSIRLVSPETVTPSEVDPSYYDLLIVDELHELSATIQDKITLEGPRFKHLLFLTATPNFRSPARHAQLFSVLEPTRTSIARHIIQNSNDGLSANLNEIKLSAWPEWAVKEITTQLFERDANVAELLLKEEGKWDELGGEPPVDDIYECAALANCLYRKVIRTRRKEFVGVLPVRNHHPIIVEPTYGESERQRLMWDYFEHLGGLSREFDPVLLAKRVILSAPSLRQRVTYLRGHGHEREGILEKVSPLLSADYGDARLDALTDLLAEIWRQDPEERVLVAAQDNLTVDHLFKVIPRRLPLVGPYTNRVRLKASCVRQGQDVEAATYNLGYGNETHENLELFQRGDSQVLFAPDKFQAGLNLQCARVIILYSVPWNPEEVEQWIGRLDRIGNTATKVKGRDVLPIDVYTIVQRGLVDEKVVKVLDCFKVFDQNINLDGEHLTEIAKNIEVTALKPQSMDWEALENKARRIAEENAELELQSDLRQHLPWGVDYAKRIMTKVENMQTLPGAINNLNGRLGPEAWDKAIDGWVKLLSRAGEYTVKLNKVVEDDPNSTFLSLWYRYGDTLPYKAGKKVLSTVLLNRSSSVANPQKERSPRNAVAFFTRRNELQQPPRRQVTIKLSDDDQVRRPLNFLNHGNPLHEDLLGGWLDIKNKALSSRVEVRLAEQHPIFKLDGEGMYIIGIGLSDPAQLLPTSISSQEQEEIKKAIKYLPDEKLEDEISEISKQLEVNLFSDIRWIRAQLPTTLHVTVKKLSSGRWELVQDGVLEALLNPYAAGKKKRHPISREWTPTQSHESRIMTGLDAIWSSHEHEKMDAWGPRLEIYDKAIDTRVYVLSVDGRDSEVLRDIKIQEALEKYEQARSAGVKSSITRSESQYNKAIDISLMAKAAEKIRLKWLNDTRERTRSLQPARECEIALWVKKHE